jgi:hypothetical protein
VNQSTTTSSNKQDGITAIIKHPHDMSLLQKNGNYYQFVSPGALSDRCDAASRRQLKL